MCRVIIYACCHKVGLMEKNMHKLRAVWVFAFILVCTIVGSVQAWAQQKIGQAAVVRGEVFMEAPDGTRVPLKAQDAIFEGYKIITGEKGKVQLFFEDASIFTVGRNAELLLNEFVYNPDTESGKSDVKATKGTFKFVTGKIAKKDPTQVKVRTPFATIGVRGSGGVVQVAGNGQTTVGLTQCCLDVAANNAPPGTPPVPLNDVNSFSRITDPSAPPTPPAPMTADIIGQLNADLSGGFEGEGEDLLGGDETTADDSTGGTDESTDNSGNEGGDESTQGGEEQSGGSDNDNTSSEETSSNNTNDQSSQQTEQTTQNEGAESSSNTPTTDNAGDEGTSRTERRSNRADGPAPRGTGPAGPTGPVGGAGQSADAGQRSPDAGRFSSLGVGFGNGGGFAAEGPGADGFGEGAFAGGGFGDGTGAGLVIGDFGDVTDNVDTSAVNQENDRQAQTGDNRSGNNNTTTASAGLGANNFIGEYRRNINGAGGFRDDDLNGGIVTFSTGNRLGLNFQGSGDTSPQFLPLPAGVGLINLNNVPLFGQLFNGFVVKPPNNNFHVYELQSTTTGDYINAIAGIEATNTPTGGAQYFSIVRDPLSSNPAPTPIVGGIVVDWTKQRFLGGELKIENMGPDFEYSLDVQYGRTFGTETSDLWGEGTGYALRVEDLSGLVREEETVTIEIDDIFAGGGNNLAGFTFDYTEQEENLITGNIQTSDERNAGVFDPTSPEAPSNLQAEVNAYNALGGTQVLEGFVGGHLLNRDDIGSETVNSIYSKSEADGTLDRGININLNSDGSAAATLDFYINGFDPGSISFGGASYESAVISSDAYALEQQLNSTLGASNTAGSGGSGVLVSDFVAPTSMQCTQCNYVHWGVWAGTFENNYFDPDNSTIIAQFVPYVAGELTPGTDLPGLEAVNTDLSFAGIMIGSLASGVNINNHTGDFNATVNFSTRNIGFDGNFAGYTLTHSMGTVAGWDAGENAFYLPITVGGAGSGSGNVYGAFFGPAAKDIGGSFKFNTSGVNGAGVFLGSQP